MARQFNIVVGINAGPARRGAREFKAASNTVVRGSTRMNRSLKATNRRAIALITTIGRIRGVATLAFAGFLGVGGIGAVVKTLGDFEQGMKRVEALLGDRAVGGAMEALTMKARELGASTAFTATQAAEGMQFLTLAGFDALETFQAIGPALELAQAGMLGLGEAADIVSNIMQGFGIEASRTQEVVDALAFVSTRTNTNIRQLGEAMKFVAPVAGAVGLSVQETSAALGLLGNSGLQASLAGTSLRRVISGLLGPSKEATAVLQGMNLSSEDLVSALGDPERGLVYVIEQLRKAGLGAAEAFTLFGQRGAPGVLSLINQTGDLREFNKQMENIEGTARTIGTTMIDSLQGDARIALSAVQESIIRLGEAGLLEWLRESTQAFTAFVRGLADIDQSLEGSSDKIQKWAARGVWMRENVDLLRKSLVVIIALMNRALIGTIVKSTVAMVSFGRAFLAGATAMQAMRRATLLLAVSMKTLRTAMITTGIGAIAVVVGLLLDYALFSDDAEDATEDFTAAMQRQQSVVDDLAFKFNGLTKAEKEAALATTELTLAQQQAEAAGLERAIRNQTVAQERMNASQERMIELQRIVAEGTDTVITRYDSYQTMTAAAREAQAQLREETERYNQAQLLMESGAWASQESLDELRASMEKNELRVRAYKDVIAGLYRTVEEAIAAYNGITNAQAEFARQLKIETGLTLTQAENLSTLIEKYDKTNLAIATLETGMELVQQAMAGVNQETNPERYEQLRRVFEAMGIELKKLKETLTPAQEEAKKFAEAFADLEEGLDPSIKLARQYATEVLLLQAALDKGSISQERFNYLLAILQGNLVGAIEELENTCDRVKKATECQSESAKKMQSIWDQAMRNIQDTFADAFKGAFDSASSFFDKILDAFKDMIAEMLAAWFTSGLMNLFAGNAFGAGGNTLGTVFGAIGGGGGGGAAAGGGGILGNAGSFIGAIGKGFSAAIKGSAAFAAMAGFFKSAAVGAKLFLNAGFGSAQIATGGSAGATAGAVGVGAGIGGLTGTVANQVFGGRGDPTRNAIFSVIGGAVGSIWGPIGSVIGGAIGSLVDNLIGGAKKLESASLDLSYANGELEAQTEQVISTQRSFFRGRKFKTTTENVTKEFQAVEDVINEFFNTLVLSAEALGGELNGLLENFSFTQVLNTKGRSEDSIQGSIENFIYDVFEGGITAFLDTVTGLEPYVEATLETFARGLVDGLTTNVDALAEQAEQDIASGGGGLSGLLSRVIQAQIEAGSGSLVGDAQQKDRVETFIEALNSLVTISGLLGADLISIVQDIEEAANRSALDNYRLGVDAFREVLAGYDGSLTSLQEVAAATQVLVEVQGQLIAIYREVGREISSLFQDSAQTVREALLNEEELYNLRRSQIDELVEQARNTIDPEELQRLAQEINRLGLDAFNLLDEGQQGELGAEFIDFFDGLDDLFGEQIMAGIGAITDDQSALNQEVADRLLEVAQAQLDAANSAQDTFDSWREWLERERYGGGGSSGRERELIP